jgi:hypothetical protein
MGKHSLLGEVMASVQRLKRARAVRVCLVAFRHCSALRDPSKP